MKKRAISLLLALVLALSPAPAASAYDGQASQLARAPARQDAAITEISPTVTGWVERVPCPEQTPAPGSRSLYGAYIDENQVYQTINSFRSVYYEGMYWTNESENYVLSVPVYDESDGILYTMTGYGCVAFCYRLSDAAFGKASARNVYRFSYDDVHIGDILRVNNNEHSVTVLEKYSDHVVLAEANVNSSVHWGRTMTRDEVMRANYITTRYPSPSMASLDVSVDKFTVLPDEKVTISIDSIITSTYNIKIWKGAQDSGELAWEEYDVSPASTYWFSTPTTGFYTAYVEARNGNGQLISGTAAFTVSDGTPFDVTVGTDKTGYSLGETVQISYHANNAASYNLSIWLGDYSTGTRVASGNGYFTGRAAYQPKEPGTYTLYVEAVNSRGASSATCRFSVTGGPDSGKFLDVPPDAYYADAVNWAAGKGIAAGVTDTVFSPGSTVTRAQAVSFLWRAANQPAPSGTGNDFTDVSGSAYYFPAVQWAVENGITYGVTDTEFRPNGNVTRGQMITFLWRAQGRPGATGQGAWYADAEYWARSNSLLSGTPIPYATNADCPRSDVIYYLWNAMT